MRFVVDAGDDDDDATNAVVVLGNDVGEVLAVDVNDN